MLLLISRMVESIFVSPNQLEGIEESGANHLIIVTEGLNKEIWDKLKELGIDLSISVNAFGPDGCPANPQSKEKLFNKIRNALEFQPKEIWIDHFRFDGHWEAIEKNKIPGIHTPCEFCSDKTRVDVLRETAQLVMDLVGNKTKVGYFAVPFKSSKVSELVTGLGQDHSVVGRIFDMSSPMLYQQMIKKPTSYISEHIRWLSDITQKPVLPIIQVKSMPDDLEDTITEDVINSEFQEAIKEPSLGVCFFWWVHALEKGKTGIIKNLFTQQRSSASFSSI